MAHSRVWLINLGLRHLWAAVSLPRSRLAKLQEPIELPSLGTWVRPAWLPVGQVPGQEYSPQELKLLRELGT